MNAAFVKVIVGWKISAWDAKTEHKELIKAREGDEDHVKRET